MLLSIRKPSRKRHPRHHFWFWNRLLCSHSLIWNLSLSFLNCFHGRSACTVGNLWKPYRHNQAWVPPSPFWWDSQTDPNNYKWERYGLFCLQELLKQKLNPSFPCLKLCLPRLYNCPLGTTSVKYPLLVFVQPRSSKLFLHFNFFEVKRVFNDTRKSDKVQILVSINKCYAHSFIYHLWMLSHHNGRVAEQLE